jgi:hypothetical protein
VRGPIRAICCAALLAIPTVLAFFSGGYFTRPRLIAGIAACAILVVALSTGCRPLPRGTPGRVAVAGLAGLAALTLLSLLWAPVRGPAGADGQRLLLYLTAFVAAISLLREEGAARVVEPALAAGSVVVIGYGLSERLLPGLVHLSRSLSAAGRLEQPLTYANATGALAAMGFALCVFLASDRARPRAVRVLAAAAAPELGLGLFLALSRGALVALAAGLVVMLTLASARATSRSAAIALVASVVVSLAAAPFDWVTTLQGGRAHGRAGGAVVLVVLVAVMGVAGAAQAWSTRPGVTEPPQPARPWTLRRPRLVALALALLAVAAVTLAASVERRPSELRPGQVVTASRLTSVRSARFDYWRVAIEAFANHPLLGAGSSGFAVEWQRERPYPEPAKDAHSLYVETPGELGIGGLAALVLFVGGVALCAARPRPLAAGAAAALTVWAVHAGLDWDWEMPAVSLVAILLAGMVVAQADRYLGAPAQ